MPAWWSYVAKNAFLVFPSKISEMEYMLKSSRGDGEGAEDGIVRLRGLPFGCTKEEIANFFTGPLR